MAVSATVGSLRERSKAKRRVAIQRAAMRLFAERGYDGTTIAEIAEEAEVAPRTVSLYFPSKLDLALSTSEDVASRLIATFHEHPELTFTEAVDRWLAREEESTDVELTAMNIAMLQANPVLRALFPTRLAQATRVTGSVLAAQLHLAPDNPTTAIVSASVGGAIAEYLRIVSKCPEPHKMHGWFMEYLCAIIEAANP